MKTFLLVFGGGIGNIIHTSCSIQSIINDGHIVDLMLHCNSAPPSDLEIFKIRGVREIYHPNKLPDAKYDFQINGPFTPGFRHQAKIYAKTADYARHYPESDLYYDVVKKLGIKSPKQYAKIKITNTGQEIDKESVAIYPGSKHEWAMKRWDKYDELAKSFEKVILVGTKKDVESHGNPTWIQNPWNWPDHVEVFHGTLMETAWIIRNCKMFIGNDGGLAHIAAATKTPTYIIFGPSSDVKNKPYNKDSYVIKYNDIKSEKLTCQPCQFGGENYFGGNKIGCPFGMKCMAELTVKDVLDQIDKKLIS